MVVPDYDIVLVMASIVVSVMASFTGLMLTRGLSRLDDSRRKLMIVMASLALGGGIWSMHFVAMLAMRLPLPVSYDAVYTLGSALIATLMSGLAFLILHYWGRERRHVIIAGAILGNGIVAMHYVGMSGIRGCLPVFLPDGTFISIAGASLTGIAALWLSYRERTTARIFLGAVLFGLAVVLVHFVAMYWTQFEALANSNGEAPMIDPGMLALLVMLSAFVICGTFLLTATAFMPRAVLASGAEPAPALRSGGSEGCVAPVLAEGAGEVEARVAPEELATDPTRLPYERDKRTYFIHPDKVAAIRAEGHYTILYAGDEKLFCPLSISVVEKRLPSGTFMRTHRSYLVNMARVAAFERRKDNGLCVLDGVSSLKSAPVSRAFVPQVRAALGI